MAKIGALNVDLTMETVTFERDISRAVRSFNEGSNRMQASMARIEARANSVANTIKGTLFAVLSYQAIEGFGRFVRGSLEATGGLGEFAAQLGISTDFLQAMQYAATQVGLSQEDLATTFAKLTANMGGALEGNKQLQVSFRNLGVSVVDAGGNVKSTEQVFREIVAAISRIPNAAQRAAAAKDLMGKSAQKMMPLIEGGARGLRDLEAAARSAGVVLDSGTIAAADKASDALSRLELQTKKIADRIIGESAPAIYQFTQKLEGLVSNPDLQAGLEGIAQGFDLIATSVVGAVTWIGKLRGTEVKRIDDQMADLQEKIASIEHLKGRLSGTQRLFASDADVARLKQQLDVLKARKALLTAPDPGGKTSSSTATPSPTLSGRRVGFLSTEDVNNAKADKRVLDELTLSLRIAGNEREKFIEQWSKRLSDTASKRLHDQVRVQAGRLFDRNAQDDLTKSIEEAMRAYDAEANSIGMTSAEAEAYRLEQALVTEEVRRYGYVSVAAEAQIAAAREQALRKLTENERKLKLLDREIELSDHLRQSLLDVGTAGLQGFGNMANAARRFASEISEATVQMYVLKPLIESVLGEGRTSAFGAGGLAGVFGSLFGSGGGASGGGTIFGPLPAFASGGVSDRPGIFAESGPEAAVPLPDGRTIPVTLGGHIAPKVSVQVINNARAEVQTQSETGPDGEALLRLTISEVRKDMARGGFDAPQRARFGVVPRRVKR